MATELELEARAARRANAVRALQDLRTTFTGEELAQIEEMGLPLSAWFGADGQMQEDAAVAVGDFIDYFFDRLLPPVTSVIDGVPLDEQVKRLNDGKGLREMLEPSLATLKAKRGSPELQDFATAISGLRSTVAPDGTFDFEASLMGYLSSGALDQLTREAATRLIAVAASRIAPGAAVDLLMDSAAIIINGQKDNANRPEA